MTTEKKYHYVYKTTNLINNKFYIGKHSTNKEFEKDNYLGSGTIITNAIKKYGKENFKIEILSTHLTEKEAYDEEARVVTTELVLDENCYNMHEGGLGGWCHSIETKKLISEKRIATNDTENRILGYNKISQSSLGKPKSDTHKENIRLANIGKTIPDETRKKISDTLTGRKREDRSNDDVRHDKIGKAHKGRKYITHPETNQIKKVNVEEVAGYLEMGWELGRLIEDTQKGKKQPTGVCPHCQVEMSKSNLSRHIKSKH